MKAVLTEEEYVARHRAIEDVVRKYAWTVRGRRGLTGGQVETMSLRSSASLGGMNMHVRIAVARSGIAQVRRLTRGGLVHFLTLTPVQFAVPVGAAAEFDTTGLGRWVEMCLEGLNYLGMVDAGYISNFAIDGVDGTVAWHAHVLIWDLSAELIAALTDRLNANWQSLIPGSDVAVSRTFAERGTLSRWWYIAKAPISESRVVSSGELIDDETGEIIDAMRIKDRPLRPGGAARVCAFMAHRTMPSLLLAGGDGGKIRGRILRSANRQLRAARRAELRRLRDVLLGPRVLHNEASRGTN